MLNKYIIKEIKYLLETLISVKLHSIIVNIIMLILYLYYYEDMILLYLHYYIM